MGCRLQTKEKRSETVTTEISLLVYVLKSIYETSDGFVVQPSPSAKKVRENLIVIMIIRKIADTYYKLVYGFCRFFITSFVSTSASCYRCYLLV